MFVIGNCRVLYMASRNPLLQSTPRRVYCWFSVINQASYVTTITGLTLVLFGMFDAIPGVMDTDAYIDFSWYTALYGVYFGLLSRDLVFICSEWMASSVG
ncbi:hypothetical protein EV182_006278, partial [Spiromyces aspiralis]